MDSLVSNLEAALKDARQSADAVQLYENKIQVQDELIARQESDIGHLRSNLETALGYRKKCQALKAEVEDLRSQLSSKGAELSSSEAAVRELSKERDRMFKEREEVKKAYSRLKRRFQADKRESRMRLGREVERTVRYQKAYREAIARGAQLMEGKGRPGGNASGGCAGHKSDRSPEPQSPGASPAPSPGPSPAHDSPMARALGIMAMCPMPSCASADHALEKARAASASASPPCKNPSQLSTEAICRAAEERPHAAPTHCTQTPVSSWRAAQASQRDWTGQPRQPCDRDAPPCRQAGSFRAGPDPAPAPSGGRAGRAHADLMACGLLTPPDEGSDDSTTQCSPLPAANAGAAEATPRAVEAAPPGRSARAAPVSAPDAGRARKRQAAAGPGPNSSPPYKYIEAVRKKAEREALAGVDCPDCRGFYKALASWGRVPAECLPACEKHVAGAGAGQAGGGVLNVEQMKQNASRHRYKHAPPPTPPGFWDMGFGDSLDTRNQH